VRAVLLVCVLLPFVAGAHALALGGSRGSDEQTTPPPAVLSSEQRGQANLGGQPTNSSLPPDSQPSEPMPPNLQVPGSDGSTGLDVQILLGPTCPVERPGACQNRPFSATISIRTPDGSQEITQATADDQGRLSLALDAGTYLVVPLSPPGRVLPSAETRVVVLDPGTYASITIRYDSGIR
jgi:hypothetical protein